MEISEIADGEAPSSDKETDSSPLRYPFSYADRKVLGTYWFSVL